MIDVLWNLSLHEKANGVILIIGIVFSAKLLHVHYLHFVFERSFISYSLTFLNFIFLRKIKGSSQK